MTDIILFQISRRIVNLTLLSVAFLSPFSCTLNPAGKSMDISDFFGKKDEMKFIDENFESIEYDSLRSPLLTYRVNFVNRIENLKFCGLTIQQCWVKKTGRLYAFFMIIKKSREVEKRISGRYGKWEVQGEISTQDGPLGGTLFMWSAGDIKIDLCTYFNTFRVPKYENCELVICRNMTLRQLNDLG